MIIYIFYSGGMLSEGRRPIGETFFISTLNSRLVGVDDEGDEEATGRSEWSLYYECGFVRWGRTRTLIPKV